MRVALLLSLLAACRYTGAFVCDTDEDCRARGSVGQCRLETGFCAFDDATCPSGFRYGDSAGEELSNTCAADPAMQDGGIDASTFDPSTCPAAYNGVLAGFPNAKYVMLEPTAMDEGRFRQQVARCEQGLAGATHAVIVDTPAKAAALATFVGPATTRVWVGLVQRPTATAVDSDWISFDGQPVNASLWATIDTEPDDANNNESDHQEQGGGFNSRGLYDQPINGPLSIVCECDGRATPSAVLDVVNAL